MLHLGSEIYNNEQISKVLDIISAETCLKMDCFGNRLNSQKIAKRWKLRPQAPGELGLRSQNPAQFK